MEIRFLIVVYNYLSLRNQSCESTVRKNVRTTTSINIDISDG